MNRRHSDDQQALQATDLQDPEVMAGQILEVLPQAVAVCRPPRSGPLQRVEGIEWDDKSDGQHPRGQGPNSDAIKTYDDSL